MLPPGRLLALGALLALTGCRDDARTTAERTLRQTGPPALRLEAARLYKGLFVAPIGQYFLPKPSQWPPSFHRFEPRHVRAYVDGFSLALHETRTAEEGLYVIPWDMDETPRGSPHSRFQRIDDGIYWYWFAR